MANKENSSTNNDLSELMKEMAKEMAMAIKISQDGTFDDIIEQAYGLGKESTTPREQYQETNQSNSDRSNLKINQQKEIFNNFNPNPNINLDFDEFLMGKPKKIQKPKNFYDKKVKEKLKFEEKMDHLRKKKEQDELSKISKTPQINQNSRIILERKNEKWLPIQDRVQSVLLNKNIKVENLKNNLNSNNESQIETHSHVPFNKDKFNNWVKGQQDHLFEKKLQIEEYKSKMREKEELELKQMKHNNINKSKISTNYHEEEEGPIYDRLYKENMKVAEKKLALIEKHTPSFRPHIISKPPKFSKNLSQKNIIKQRKNISMIITDNDRVKDKSPNIRNRCISQGKEETVDNDNDDTNVISRYRIALERNQQVEDTNQSIIKMMKDNKKVEQKRSKSIESPSKVNSKDESAIKNVKPVNINSILGQDYNPSFGSNFVKKSINKVIITIL